MKRQDLVKAQQQTITELKVDIEKLEQKLVDLVMKKALSQLKNVREPKFIRHDIARLKSIIRIKELTNSEIKPASSKE